MNPFDSAIISFLQGYTHRSPFLDTLVYLVMDSNFFKGGVVMGIFWWMWFRSSDQVLTRKTRETLIAAMIGAMIAVMAGKILGDVSPFRLRPMNEPGLHFIVPFGTPEQEVTGWEVHDSFPSDHAALFFSIAVGIFLVSRSLGIFLLLYLSIIIGAARVYCGVHYPTDILVGGLVGISVSLLMNHPMLRRRVSNPVLLWLQKSEATFYPASLLFSYQLIVLFNDVRSFGGFFLRVLRGGL